MLARLVDEIACEAGETIMHEGSLEYEFIVIEDGTAEVAQGGLAVNQLGPGAFFGELAVLGDGTPRTASVTATSPLSGLVFTAHFMREVRERFPAVGERIDRRRSISKPTPAGARRPDNRLPGRATFGGVRRRIPLPLPRDGRGRRARRLAGALRRRLRLLHVGGVGPARLGPGATAASVCDPRVGRDRSCWRASNPGGGSRAGI